MHQQEQYQNIRYQNSTTQQPSGGTSPDLRRGGGGFAAKRDLEFTRNDDDGLSLTRFEDWKRARAVAAVVADA